MPKRSRMPTELNRLAAAIVGKTTNDKQGEPVPEKDPAAVALGRRGGLKGGKARAAALSPEERKEGAQKAAAARWGLPKPKAE